MNEGLNGPIKLCCSRGCPTMEFIKPDEIRIKDDFGGSVILNEENLAFIVTVFEKYQRSK